MQIISKKHKLKAKVGQVIQYLSDFNNIKNLLPQSKISEWQSDKEQCSFKVQNTATISLVKKDVLDNQIFMVSGEKSPFPFKLNVIVSELEDGSEGYLQFDGEVNTFLKMMVQKPLTNLFDYMSEKLKIEMEKI